MIKTKFGFVFCAFLLMAAASSTSRAWAFQVGDAVPDFTAKNQEGHPVVFSEIKGKPILFYFYPKDETPGCTKEACSFRDEFSKFKQKGILLYGVSAQDLTSHKAFATKFHLPFDLLDDSNGALAKLFGIEKIPLVGLYKRQSVLVGKDGRVLKIYPNVDPKTHAAEVLHDVEAAKQ